MVESSLAKLESKVNNELLLIDTWLKQNKLFLNSSKSCYMSINKNPNKSCESDIRVSLYSLTLHRQHSVKYLGIFIDENLKCSTHIYHLFLQLARYAEFSRELETSLHLIQCICSITVLYTPEYNTAFQFGEMPPKLTSKSYQFAQITSLAL